MRIAFILLLAALPLLCQTPGQPVRAVTDPGVVTTRQAITPAGVPAVFQGRVYAVDFGKDSSELWVLSATHVNRLDWRQNRVLDAIPLGGSPGLQGLRYSPTLDAALTVAATRDAKGVRLSRFSSGQSADIQSKLGTFLGGALSLAKDAPIAAVPLIYNNQIAFLDTAARKTLATVKTEIAPFGAALDRKGSIAWVTNWGGRIPTPKDLTAPTGYDPNVDKVVVDARGIASTGTVQRIDVAAAKITHTLNVDPHPAALVWDEPRARLYIASSNKDRITVVDTNAMRVLRTLPVQPFAEKPYGLGLTALAISPDAARLYVACGGINAVALLNTATGALDGLIPTAWYPNTLALSPDGKRLAIGALLGAGSAWRDEPRKRFVHAYRGAAAVVELPDAAQLASYTAAVAENNHLTIATANAAPPRKPTPASKPIAIPARAGDPSLIEHVVYIIKENRTYDQVLGDLPKGNSDPSLVMFGNDVTPNQHRLSDQYVTLDNFYATGGNSADGHQWVTQGIQNTYSLWPGFTGRSYPFDGSDPLAIADSGFLWDQALARGKTVRIYGEYAGITREPRESRAKLLQRWAAGDPFTNDDWKTVSPVASMNKVLASRYPAYTLNVPDVVRAKLLQQDIDQWTKSGKMPNLVVIQIPSDHTSGTTPNFSSAKAMVADNDYALGLMVESLSKTPFWKKMAIFVVEDDAQNGVDHVDGHRTVALAISPYTRRGHVDSTFYSHQSMVKTIELILGLPTMSLFDMIAHDMRASFHDTPDYMSYTAEKPKQDLMELNPSTQALKGEARQAALASLKMNFDSPDAAPTDRVNRILWGQIRGWKTAYPGVKQAVFAPLSLDLDDDEREEK
ncbi:MAG: bifunctional YncE family protein/alkaline phosphatase family protein [Bryobacterales bacterium]|nr:bifunctional YncE family protein/alkaline phosphatase family protein [Bryobacterales bacterium]